MTNRNSTAPNRQLRGGGSFPYKPRRSTVAIFLTLFIAIGVLCFRYYDKLQSMIRNESGTYLLEISKQIGDNTNRIITDNFSILGTISTVIKNSDITSYESLQPIVLEQQRFWNYQNILLIDFNGNAFDAYGNSVMLSAGEYLNNAVVKHQNAMSTSQTMNGGDCLVFAIPLENTVIGGTPMAALAATYDQNTMDRVLSMGFFENRGFAYIIQKDGSAVIRSSSEYAPPTGYNILSTLSTAPSNAASLAKMKSGIDNSIAGMVEVSFDNVPYYAAYTPLVSQNWCLLTFVPLSVANARSSIFSNITLILCSAITIIFTLLLGFIMYSAYRHKRRLEQIAYVDPVTGGNTIQKFYEDTDKLLLQAGKLTYALVYINIEKFKVLNEQFGRSICDAMLKSLQKSIEDTLTERESMGRLFADNFCILIECEDDSLLEKRFTGWYNDASAYQEQVGSLWPSPIIGFGVYFITNATMPLPHMIDRAKLALKEIDKELHGKVHYAIYNDEVRRQLFREKHLEDMMVKALADREFLVYLQPKYKADTEVIGGAEALARWKSPTEGMIYPDEFIPTFEKNGFIIQLDLWVFEEVCRTLRSWIDAGRTPVRISVNCSRLHLGIPNFLDYYSDICRKWNVPPQYLEIELTESMVFQNVEELTRTIDNIHAAGFVCSMDDFGSGYSSLNLIQDIPVDIIKLDKVFFRKETKSVERTESVVSSILLLCKSLKLETVAEGVEERPQVDMLKRLGCDYIQGYYFARPMPIVEFEALAFKDMND